MFFHDLPRVYCMQACPWYKRSLCANNAHQQERGSQTLEETGHSLLSLFLSAISACLHISYSTSASNLRISFCYICSDRLNKANSEQNSHKMNQNVTNGHTRCLLRSEEQTSGRLPDVCSDRKSRHLV